VIGAVVAEGMAAPALDGPATPLVAGLRLDLHVRQLRRQRLGATVVFLRADASSVGIHETFYLTDHNGGSLWHGDAVSFRFADTFDYLRAQGGGGAAIDSGSSDYYQYEVFIMYRLAGPGPVMPGGQVALRTLVGSGPMNGHWVVAEGGGGDVVNGDQIFTGWWNVGPWGTFVIQY